MFFIYKVGPTVILGCCEYSVIQSKVLAKVLTYCAVYTQLLKVEETCIH